MFEELSPSFRLPMFRVSNSGVSALGVTRGAWRRWPEHPAPTEIGGVGLKGDKRILQNPTDGGLAKAQEHDRAAYRHELLETVWLEQNLPERAQLERKHAACERQAAQAIRAQLSLRAI